MAAKDRIVYFYEPIWKDTDGNAQTITSDFWRALREKIKGLSQSCFQFSHYRNEYRAWALTAPSPAVEYIYVGKRRPKQDWPDVEDENVNYRGLSETGFERNLLEAAYLVEAGHGSVVAIARTSGGPTVSAIEKMISDLLNTVKEGAEFELAPFVREDQLRRLAEADGATKFHLKIDESIATEELPDDTIGRALAEAKTIDPDGLATIELVFSFGNVIPQNESSEQLVNSVRKIVGKERSRGVARAHATLFKYNSKGKVDKEKVDFIQDRITVKGSFGGSADEQPSAGMILQGMLEASATFRENLKD